MTQVTAVRLHNQDGDLVHVELDSYWTEDQDDEGVVKLVFVKRFGKEVGLGRIDTKEKVYHVRHHELADFVRWDDRTTTLSVEELILVNLHGVHEIQYWDERNTTRYSITLDMLRSTGYIVRREKIGWRWAVPLMMWDKKKIT